MISSVQIRVTGIAYHRNGICGAPFHVVLFDDIGDENTQKIAILFDEPHQRLNGLVVCDSSGHGHTPVLADSR